MAFSSTGLRLAVDGNLLNSQGAVWHYLSADAASAVAGTGYFTRQGYGSRYPSSLLGSTTLDGALRAPASMRVGDLVCVTETTNGANPGRITWHTVLSATADQASTSASTGFAAGYNVSITST
jgi:hypothetical protein